MRSGMGCNIAETEYFNEYATKMLPQHDPGLEAVKKLGKAVFELRNVGLRSAINLPEGEKGDRSSFRGRLYMRHQEAFKK